MTEQLNLAKNLPFQLFQYILLTVSALLPIANPISTAALFMGLTGKMGNRERDRQAFLACLYMFFILVFFLFAGVLIIKFFGISIPGIRVAGGLIITVVGFRMLFPSESELSKQEEKEAIAKADIALVPLAMPSLSGPGSIAVVLSISSQIHRWVGYLVVALGILLTAAVSYWILKGSARLVRFLGINGINVFSRIMGFILICIAVQFIASGVYEFIKTPNF